MAPATWGKPSLSVSSVRSPEPSIIRSTTLLGLGNRRALPRGHPSGSAGRVALRLRRLAPGHALVPVGATPAAPGQMLLADISSDGTDCDAEVEKALETEEEMRELPGKVR